MAADDPLVTQAEALAAPWFDTPFFPQLLERAELDAESKRMVRDFAEQGYVIFDPKIPDAWLNAANAEVKDCFRPNFGSYSDERRVQDAWLWGEHVKKIATAPRVIEVLEMLYRRRPFPFQTLNFRIGSEQKTHSDMAFFDSIPHGYMCGVWVALEDVDETNGPLHYYPQSQKLPTFNVYDLGVIASRREHGLANIARYEEFVAAMLPATGLARTHLSIKRGQALIWSANLYHGGCPILDTSRTRHTQVTHYYFEGCLYYTPLNSDPGIGRIEPRKIIDARDCSVAPQYYNGKLILNPGEWPPRLADEAEQVIESDVPLVAEPEKRRLSILKWTFDALRRR